MTEPENRKRWLALYVLCLGVLMIVLDTTIVTVALPSIKSDLGFTDTSLVWVLNAYMLTFGGCLLLGGRLGDLYGNRRLFLLGLALFTLASLACGISGARWALVLARAVQGVGGAVVTAVALALIMNLFTEEGDRARAMGFYGFVCAAGGSIGAVLGGFITSALSWNWIFLVNLPIGLAVYAGARALLPRDERSVTRRLDLAGAFTVTAGLMLAVYAVADVNRVGWLSAQTLSSLACAGALIALFIVIELRVRDPLMPLRLFRLRNLAVSNVIGVAWAAGMFAWFVISALYLQLILGDTPLEVGLAFVPSDMIMAAFSLGLSARIVTRYGLRAPLAIGLLLAAAGLVLFARAPLNGTFAVDVLPGMLLLGLGAGLAFNPLLLAAMNDVTQEEAGLASGMVNTSFMMGGALGLALLASLADARTAQLRADGVEALAAQNGGYHLAFFLGALLCAAAGIAGAVLLRDKPALAEENSVIPAKAGIQAGP